MHYLSWQGSRACNFKAVCGSGWWVVKGSLDKGFEGCFRSGGQFQHRSDGGNVCGWELCPKGRCRVRAGSGHSAGWALHSLTLAELFGCSCYSKMMVEDGDRLCMGDWGRKNKGKQGEKILFWCHSGEAHLPACPSATLESTHLSGCWELLMWVKKAVNSLCCSW